MECGITAQLLHCFQSHLFKLDFPNICIISQFFDNCNAFALFPIYFTVFRKCHSQRFTTIHRGCLAFCMYTKKVAREIEKNRTSMRFFFNMEERMGFEPTNAVNVTAFPMLRLRPLGHLSISTTIIIIPRTSNFVNHFSKISTVYKSKMTHICR